MDQSQRLLFRCDGGQIPEVGTGHLHRCLLLAKYHMERYRSQASFLMREDKDGEALVRGSGVPITLELIPAGAEELAVLGEAMERLRPDVCVIDQVKVADGVLELCRRQGVISVTLDADEAAVAEADVAINAILENPRTPYSGPGFVVLPEAGPGGAGNEGSGNGFCVFVSAGGYDRGGLAPRIVAALRRLPEIARIRVATTSGELAAQCAAAADGRIEVVEGAPELHPLLRGADLAVVSGGLTLFEAMRMGVPSVVLAQYPHQAVTAQRYATRGAAVALGLAGRMLESQVEQAVAALLSAPQQRRRLGRAASRLVDGQGLRRVAELIHICEFLDWDTAFFGKRIAQLKPLRLTESIMRYALARCAQWSVECAYYQCDCHDPESVRLAERHGFHFVDIRITFERDTTRLPAAGRSPQSVRIRLCREEDIPRLKEIAGDSYLDSRYYFDQRFPRERCRAFYTEWVEKCARGYVDQVLVAERAGSVLGFVACRRVNAHLGNIDLLAVDPSARNGGVGRSLVYAAARWFAEHEIAQVQVVTQGRNYPSQRLYQRCGFVTQQTHLWYHKWFDGRST